LSRKYQGISSVFLTIIVSLLYFFPVILLYRRLDFRKELLFLSLNIKYVKFLIKNIKVRVKRKFKTENRIKVPYIFEELSIILKYYKSIIQLNGSLHFNNKYEFLKFIILKFFNF